jgi:uncharacterized membrane protein YdjX (TVP38/TMEM64 family)
MAIPADVLSYALGLLVMMPYTHYFLATLIGVTPFALIFAYATTLATPFIVGALILALLASTAGIWWIKRQLHRQSHQATLTDTEH